MDRLSRSSIAAMTELDTRGLFIVGHARAGTSILQDALNSSGDIYMFGEANFQLSASRDNFVDWYNAMHRELGNPEYKSTYCPEVFSEGMNGFDTLVLLSRRFKYVGDKLAFRSEKLGYDFEGFLRFGARYFMRSAYICALRNPLHIITSCLDMFEQGSRTAEAVDLYAESFLRCIYLQLRVLLLFNRTYFVVHDRISENTFETLSKHLTVDFSDSWLFYDDKLIHKALPADATLQAFPSVQRAAAVYARLLDEISNESLRPRSLLNCRSLMYQLRNELAAKASG
jgi:hypothetical protein